MAMALEPQLNDRIVSPFTILRDTRENNPWKFQGLRASAKDGGGILLVKTEWHNLGDGMGDYTLAGMEDEETGWRVSIERKSMADLYSTILSGRERFEVELANLNRMEYAAVVVEGDWCDLITYEAPHWEELGLNDKEKHHRRKTVVRSIIA